MKVAHFYPGLRYKSAEMKREIFSDREVQQKLLIASAVLGRDVAALCQTQEAFASTRECLVASLAASVAVGTYYLQRYGQPDVILASSFGHYAALVMANALPYAEALMLASNNGRIFDDYFANFSTWLVSGIPFTVLKQLEDQGILVSYADGLTLTFPRTVQRDIERYIRERRGIAAEIPLRLKYHSEYMGAAEKLTGRNLIGLRVRSPQVPFLSTYYSDFVRSPEAIIAMLGNLLSGDHYLEETMAIIRREGIIRTVHMQTSSFREHQIEEADGRN